MDPFKVFEDECKLLDIDLQSNYYHKDTINLSGCDMSIIPINGIIAINPKFLNLSDNRIEVLPNELKLATNLEWIDISSNLINNISILNDIHRLKRIDAMYNDFDDISLNLPHLLELNLSYSGITSLDISQCPNLINLESVGNSLSRLNLANNTHLLVVNLSSNNLQQISLSTSLRELYCMENKLSEINIPGNSELRFLSLSGNQFTSIPILPKTLKTLHMRFNPIENIDNLIMSNVLSLKIDLNVIEKIGHENFVNKNDVSLLQS